MRAIDEIKKVNSTKSRVKPICVARILAVEEHHAKGCIRSASDEAIQSYAACECTTSKGSFQMYAKVEPVKQGEMEGGGGVNNYQISITALVWTLMKLTCHGVENGGIRKFLASRLFFIFFNLNFLLGKLESFKG